MIDCKVCNKVTKNKVYCSKECYSKGRIGVPRPDVVIRNKTNNPVWDKVARDKMANSLRGKPIARSTVEKRLKTMAILRKTDPTLTERQVKGLRAHTTKMSVGWKSMRKKALERDNNTCQICGANDRKLMVHHKDHKGRNLPSLKMMNNDLSNLITLCYPCHTHIHVVVSRRGGDPLLI